VAVAASCSKNFGLYRERTGALHVMSETPAAADAVLSQLVRTARSIYSMPPDHGAAIVHNVLADDGLRKLWADEVAGMRRRLQGLRQQVMQHLAKACPRRDFGFIATQRGMFSFLGLDAQQVLELRTRHHIYMTDDSRMNIAGLREDNLEYFAHAVARVLKAR